MLWGLRGLPLPWASRTGGGRLSLPWGAVPKHGLAEDSSASEGFLQK